MKKSTVIFLLIAVTFIVIGLAGSYIVVKKRGIPFVTEREQWTISIYEGESPFTVKNTFAFRNPVLKAEHVTDVPAKFVADPFLMEEDATWYLFFEVYNLNSKHGDIAVATSTDTVNWDYKQIVLDEPFHLSYPYVFKWDSDIYLIPADADEHPEGIRCLTAHDGDVGFPSVSPDGTHVALLGHGQLETFPQNAHVGTIPIDGTSTSIDDVNWISKGLDRTFICMAGMRAPLWESNDSLLATAEDRGDNHLYRLTADASAPPEALTTGRLTVHSFDQAGGTLVTTRSTIGHTPELFVGEDRRTTVGDALAAQLLPWEKFTAPTTDGTNEIDVWVMRPADFEASKTYPVLLNVHGGPFTQYGDYFFDEAQIQAAAGFVVVLGNPRGGSGREESWGQAVLGPKHPVKPGSGWGALDVDDVLAILDSALDRFPFCDPERVGMLGGSYGGFMATWLAGHHGDRFRAFCSERAVNNLLSEEWSSDIASAFRTEHGPSHIEDPSPYVDASPINAVRDIDKPMLLIHSEEDWRCPIVQAEELWIALKLLGKEVDFYRFPGENHELSRNGSPIHRVQRAEIILDWFADKLA